MNRLRGLLLAACLFTAPSAFAIPLGITIDIEGAAIGQWTLSGPTSDGDWFFGDYSKILDVLPGTYSWTIGGGGWGASSWTVALNGTPIHSGAASGTWSTFGFFAIDDEHDFGTGDTGRVTPVPEPGALALLGLGVTALGLSMRRKASKA